jgi:NodT family efflux transporter outer membrane factor (OMF) lipoprotein
VTRVDAAPRAAGGAARLCLGCEALRRLGCAGFGTWLALSGCAAGPDFKPPPAPSALQYTDTADSAAPSGGAELQHIAWGRDIEGSWWELFRSQPIDAIVKQAIDHNYSLAASTATLAESRELALAQAGGQYPQIGANGGIGKQKYGQEFLGKFGPIPPFTYFAVGPTVSYTVDYTGGVARGVEREFALSEVARQEMHAAYLSVTGQAVMQTLAIASTRVQIATIETLLAQDRDDLRLVETAFQAGSVAREDVVSAESQIASDLTLLPPLRQDLARGRHALSVLLGQSPDGRLPADLELAEIALPAEIPVALPSELVHRRPDILAAEARLHAATSAVGVADSNLYPKIVLSASAAQEGLSPGALFEGGHTAWSLISGVTAPIFDAGTLRAQQRAAVDEMHASAARYEQTVLEAFAQVADSLDSLDHDSQQLDAQTQAERAAASSLELARASYHEGNVGVLQVLDAERSYQRARLGFVRSEAQRYLDTVQLFLALGGTAPASPGT